jgi:signal peptide peptidase SppA
LHGVITATSGPVPRSVINAAGVDKALERAFAPERLAAVALLVNSPGGAATQSALVADRIRGLADEKGVPVLAFCEDVAASGGYWLACAADEIFAHPTSLVGSIGVISQGFGLDGLIERFGVQRRLYTAGPSKSRLDPFLPEKQEDVDWLRDLQDQLHGLFQQWVVDRRGDRLRTEAELFTGEVWTGARAVELGLVDGLGTGRAVLTERFPEAELVPVEGRKPLLARLGLVPPAAATSMISTDAVLGVAEAAAIRATWARYGL